MAKKKVQKKTPAKKQKKAAAKKSLAGKEPIVKKDPLRQLEEPKPEFEQSIKGIAGSHQPAAEPEEKKDGRGGPRPGAGRPKGVTDDFAAVNRLPEKANETLIPVLQMPFAIWAKSQGVDELAINKDEAKDLALPVTQLLEFYFPGRIPEIAWVWLMFTGTTYRILESRLELLASKRKAKGSSVAAGVKGPASSSRPQPGPAQPAGGYPKDE